MSLDNLGLLYEDEIILKSSYANVHFDYPNFKSYVTFSLHADNEMRGFTVKELALKMMQRYHLLYFLFDNYDMTKGKLFPDKKLIGDTRRCFRPCLFTGEWYNGLKCICYDKEFDRWTFECINAI